MLINKLVLQLSLLMMHRAAILDFEVKVGEVFKTSLVGNVTSVAVPVQISNRKLGNSNFQA